MTRLKYKNFILSFILFGSLIFSICFTHTSFFKSDDESSNQANTPDAFMTIADYKQYNAKGELQSHIQAKRITHYSDQDSALIESPKILANSDNHMQWTITAEHGKSQHGLNVITLTDNVEVHRIELPNKKVTILKTTSLTAYLPKKYVETNQPVTITQAGSIIHSVGMNADLKTGKMNLLSGVSGTYEKN